MKQTGADILVGGVKERPLAYKLGIAFCDHNHERKHALAGYDGVINFTEEVNRSINSPVWQYLKTSRHMIQGNRRTTRLERRGGRMSMNLVNLNVNPCKMCMPMGSVSAFYGIKGCMTLLHGSQGCSTYIRRHMATHYNEPVDIASSSLTEQGTVFGGEKNLVKGLENLISLYQPEVIGVATTCLAETIGEDIPRMIRDFLISHPEHDVKIIPVSSCGYSGTQYEVFLPL